MKDYIAVIQAGGKGTRLAALTGDKIPKPMLPLNGKPMIQWQMENLAAFGIREFVLIIGHLGDKVEEYFSDGSSFGVRIHYIREEEPLGSAGALWYLKEIAPDRPFILVFGDVMFELDWDRMIRFHESHGGLLTTLVHPNAHPFDSDLLALDQETCRVTGFDSKNKTRDYWYDNIVNAGIYIAEAGLLEEISGPVKTDFEAQLMLPLIRTGRVFGYRTPEFVKDAGTVERFQQVEEAQKRGVWKEKCLTSPQKCIFLDRDGTINIYRGLITEEEQLELMACAGEAIRRINASGYLAICVTNQPIVARGEASMEDVYRFHRKLAVMLGNEGAYLDDLAFCPHHPDKGFPGERPEYKIKCNCRKPATGMIDIMVERYNIDISQSYMVGDMTMDILCGQNAGLRTILLESGYGGKDGKYQVTPDAVTADLLEAVKLILNETD